MSWFKNGFDSYACVGDTIETEVSGFDVEARIEFDQDTRPQEYECYSEAQIKAWKQDKWFYCGVVLSVSRAGVELDNCAASLWGIECNFPGSDNSHLRDVADELVSEAIDLAQVILKQLLLSCEG